ncbi:hypothetical protein [Nocardioides sp. CFH 31398]|uniref:hypothetical protein n=1 Tax=Nocardioides sp. CFH 31398 TaxID=2919579 RepID=UPI001F05379D|nr:hypothetical protein [Nocardioides sp. CFH 31398]MCH1868471.1 hypothetical protein [Nocardioides sp. CFH 31398]
MSLWSRLRPGARERAPQVPSAAGERVLAWARTIDGEVVAGTRDALHLPGDRRLPWERVETADWDEESGTLHVVEVGDPATRGEHRYVLEDVGLLLSLVRERVTASIVLQRHVAVRGRRGFFVIARRAPAGEREVTWALRHDAGVDPADPEVRRAAADALERARGDIGAD